MLESSNLWITFTACLISMRWRGVVPQNSIELQCPQDWVRHRTHCYLIQDYQATWNRAREICEKYGANLVKIRDVYTNNDLGDIALRKGITMYWIGLYVEVDATESLSSRWSDGETVPDFRGFWMNAQPTYDSGHCVYSSLQDNSTQWSYGNCEWKRHFVCEMRACPKGTYRCSDGGCINQAYTCDGVDDCSDGSDELNCPSRCRYLYNEARGEISSPNFPDPYNSLTDCSWLIQSPLGTHLQIQFQTLETEPDEDEVLLFGGGPTLGTSSLLARLSGTIGSRTILSPNNFILVKFYTNAGSQQKGFRASWTTVINTVPSGGETLQASSLPSLLTSPSYPDLYLPHQETLWIIQTRRRWKLITLQFIDLDLAPGDTLLIRSGDDANSPVLRTLTSQSPEEKHILSTTSSLYLLLHTGFMSSHGHKGFSLNYYEGCDVMFYQTHGYITSPGYDVINYPNYQSCGWTIITPLRRRVTLIFDTKFGLDNPGDYIKIFDGENEGGVPLHGFNLDGFTGDTAPAPTSVQSGSLFIKFTTNSIVNGLGFAARFSVGCSVPNFNDHTKVQETISAYDFGLKMTVYCDPGYAFNSDDFYQTLPNGTKSSLESVQMECLFGGTWNVPRVPQCIRGSCGPYPEIENGYMISSTGSTYGDTATYTCVRGELQGGASITCGADNAWSTPPTCIGTACPVPTLPSNLRLVDTNGRYPVAGSVIRFECEPGYVVSGQPILLCGETGQWNGEVPVCEELTCYVPTIANGQVERAGQQVRVRTSLTVSCNQGYQILGPSSIQCQLDRSFTELPTCTDTDECAANPCEPGAVCVNTEGSFTCGCPPGRERQGSVCVDIAECSVKNGYCDDVCIEEPGGYRCECGEGHSLYTHNGTQGIYLPPSETGLRPDNTLYINHSCVRNLCTIPPLGSNIIVMSSQDTYRYGDNLILECETGYEMQGIGELLCGALGEWSHSVPTCVLRFCPFDDVSGITNLAAFDMSRRLYYGQMLDMTCTVNGVREQRQRTCQFDHHTGQYRLVGDSYDCQQKSGQVCVSPKLDQHSLIRGMDSVKTSLGSTYTFRCDPHYIYTAAGASTSNSDIVRCGGDGSWGYGDLHCLAMSCPYPRVPPGAEVVSVSGGYMYNTQIVYRCVREGYTFNTSSAITCVQSETGGSLVWNSTLPECKDTEAPRFPSCPSADLKVRLYEPAGFKIPTPADNSGSVASVTVTPPYFNPSLPVRENLLVTYTAVDHAGNSADCTVSIITKDEEPPAIKCVGSRSIEVDASVTTVTFGDNDVIASDNSGPPTVTFQPSSLRVSLAQIGENFTVTATARDIQGNTARCFFQVVVKALACHPLSLPEPLNTIKNCVTVGTGYKCTYTCQPGFYFLEDYTGPQFVTECQRGGKWTRSYVPSCGDPGQLARVVHLSIAYSVFNTPSDQCKDRYLTSVLDKLSNQTDLCSPSAVTGVIENDVVVSANFDDTNNQLTVDVELPLAPYGLNNSEYTACTNIISEDFQLMNDLDSQFYPLSELSALDCPTLQGTPLNTNSLILCEGRGTYSPAEGVCKVCPPGTSYNSTGQCELCPEGTYQNQSGEITCEPCPQETWTEGEGKTGIQQCIRECPGELISDTGFPPCRQCPPNMYKVDSNRCMKCAEGTRYTGSDNPLLSDCKESACEFIRRENQQMVGTDGIMKAMIGTKQCQKSCNSFRSRFEKRQCLGYNFFKSLGLCFLYDTIDSYQSTGLYDFYERSCPQVTRAECFCAPKCPAGSFSYNGHQPFCRGCPIGFYSPTAGTISCQECPEGETTLNMNSTAITDCVSAATVLCRPGPCLNSGLCRIVGHSEECDCLPGFTGRHCDVQIDTCASIPCHNGGSCQSSSGTAFSCKCVNGYTGVQCETNINDCTPDQCREGGVCIDEVGSSRCVCVEGYSGPRCEVESTNPCQRYPCQNGGSCVEVNPFWRRCDCLPQFEGEDCERDAVEATCDSTPCLNGGTCTDVSGGVVCSCLAGFSGAKCEAPNQTCSSRDCGASRDCIDDPITGLSWCICQPGYQLTPGVEWTAWYNSDDPTDGNDVELVSSIREAIGPVCLDAKPIQTECRIKGKTTLITGPECTDNGISCTSGSCLDYEVRFRCPDIVAYKDSVCTLNDHCTRQNPCENQGVCENIPGGYQCVCPPQYTGANCQLSTMGCDSQSCLHGGTCTEGSGGFSCQCLPGYTGATCEVNPDDCERQPCSVSGTAECVDGVNEFTCVCLSGFTGDTCQTNIDECESSPCLHGGICEDLVNNFTCQCPEGWTGRTCDVLVDQCSVTNPCGQNSVCRSLFGDTYCQCLGGATGPTCETVPDMCNLVNPCVTPATCVNNGTTPTCLCPKDRTGYDCGLLTSVQCDSSLCEHGGTCRRTLTGDKCACAVGYTGSRCELTVDHCVGVTCPSVATCISGQLKHFCRCPVGKMPPDCLQDIDVDYDLWFVGTSTPGKASLPYSVLVTYTDGFTVTLWVKFSVTGGRGTFFSLYEDLSENGVRSTRLILEISEAGLNSNLDNNEILLPFLDGGQSVSDGEWHHLVVTWHTIRAVLTLYLDGTVQHQQEDFTSGLPLPSRLWVVLGSNLPLHPTNDTPPFQGCVSQVNIYGRNIDSSTELEVYTAQPKYVFETGSVLRWAEYELYGSTLVSRPSTARYNTCPEGFTDPPACATQKRDVVLMRVLFCPDNKFLEAPRGSVQVQWETPQFAGASSVTSNYRPGEVFTTGSHEVVYIGRDKINNTATCSFTVFVNREMCPTQANPRGGGGNSCQSSAGSWPYTVCTPTCPASTSALVQSAPLYYTCGPGGDWTSLDHSDGLYPVCGQRMNPSTNSVSVRLQYSTTSVSCQDLQNNLDKLRQNIQNLNLLYGGVLCKNNDCSGVKFEIACQSLVADVIFVIPDIVSEISTITESLTPNEILTRAVLDENRFTVAVNGENISPNLRSFDAVTTDFCPDGQIPVGSFCYTCGPGTYHNTSMNTCDNCPKGAYQSQFGATTCQSCDQGETTLARGSTESSSCTPLCNEGEFYSTTNGTCELCPPGTYQDQPGQMTCFLCPGGQQTGFWGAVSQAQCTDRCESGYELTSSGQCGECPVGTYREKLVDRECRECPAGFITPGPASATSAQCSIVACPIGHFLNSTTNLCDMCPVGTYQDRKWQTSCTSCGGERYRTDIEGATSQDQCRFFCQSGEEVVDNIQCRECQIGTYKDNTVDVYSSCLPCPGNSLTPSTGTTSIAGCTVENACPSGQQLVTTECQECPVGFFKDNTVNPMSMCNQCPAGYVTQGLGATAEADCSIRDCPPGTKISSSGDSCDLCPLQTYQPLPYQRECILCETGLTTSSNGSVSVSQCLKFCPSGEEMEEGGGCSPCPRGTYKDNTEGQLQQCQLCPPDYITPAMGAESSALCTVRNCSAGHRLNETDNTCVECEPGNYQPDRWQTRCEQCPDGTLTTEYGSTSIADCKLVCSEGREDQNGSCGPCALGYFKSVSGPKDCMKCPDGFRTGTVGAVSEVDCNIVACDPGSYLDDTSNECVACMKGRYQPDKWQESCLPCPNNLTTYNTGAVSQDQCLLECESGQEYSLSTGQCELCGQGFYRDAADRQDRCQLCPVEFITARPGATHKDNCTVANCSILGQYLDVDANVCVECPVGTFQDQRWATGCQLCGEGLTTRLNGTDCFLKCFRDCQSGTQVIESDNTCEECPVGQYRSRDESWTCVMCEKGTITAGRGAKSSKDCKRMCDPGTALESKTNTCEPCPVGRYQPRSNKADCVPCPNNQTTETTGSDSIDKCFSWCSKKSHNCSGPTECVDRPDGFLCQCQSAYVGPSDNCTHVCDLPSYCTNQGICQKETLPACLCPEFYSGETCEIRIAPTSSVDSTIIGTVIGVVVFLLLLALVLVGIYSRRRYRNEEESFEETSSDDVSMAPSSYMTVRTSTAPYAVLHVAPLDTQEDPAFYSAKQQSEVERGYISYENERVLY